MAQTNSLMTNLKKWVQASLLTLTTTLILVGCGSSSQKEKELEGVIVYDVTFPYNQDDILIHLYPSEFILEFKGEKAHGYLASVGGVVATEIIADSDKREMHHMLKSFNDRLTCTLTEPDLKKVLAEFPDLSFLPTDKKIELAGYECDRTVAMFNVDSVPPIELLHTKDLGIKNPNWYSQFSNIPGVLLGYEIEQYGMRMKLRAKEIRFEEIDDATFEISPLYRPVEWEELEGKLEKLVTEGI